MSENGSVGSQERDDSNQSLQSHDFEEVFNEIDKAPEETPASSTETCPHPGYLAGMCIRCGADKPNLYEDDNSVVPFRYLHRLLEFSKEEAHRLSEQQSAVAEAAGKLQLVVDLDHTLLHSAPIDILETLPRLKEWVDAEIEAESENPINKRTLYEVPSCYTVTKLRPGVFTFLQALSPLYEMHIYTMGEENYALEMARLLDPEATLFRGRVISRDHSSTPMTKNLDVVFGSERSTIIVDDTWQVWTHHTDNLLSVSKYVFFPSMPFAWLDINADESSTTGELNKIRSALERVHVAYFDMAPEQRDVRLVLKTLFSRKRI